jgi:putative tryptophan/tyrosine transport system substrate-binding protein
MRTQKSKIVNLSIALFATILLWAGVAEAQPTKKVHRIGYLTALDSARESARSEAIRLALRDRGYIEGQNVNIEYRYAAGKLDRLPELAAELVRLKVDIIMVTGGITGIRPAKNATKTIPIVMVGLSADPVHAGLVESLARPGGNVTGLTNPSPELGGKQLELLKETIPRASRVAVLRNPASPASTPQLREIEVAGRSLGVQLHIVEAQGRNDFDKAFGAMKKDGAQVLNVLASAIFTVHRTHLVELASKARLPAIYPHTEFVNAGGLMSYGADRSEMWRRAAVLVDKILKGAKPADLPVEQPMKFEFIINLKTAKQIGLTIPQSVLFRADKVIR